MTTEKKLEKIRWYINQIDGKTDVVMRNYFCGVAQGINNAWFMDGSITLGDFEAFNQELNKIN